MNPQQLQGLIIPIGFLVVFYLFAIRPQKKRENQIKDMRSSLKVGDNVITIGGIHGKITVVREDILTVEVGPNKVKLDVTKWAVGSVVGKDLSGK